ncbi:GNAT family N-acetyltransferase [Chitinivorax sp. PXF-14]|uniref:GNAT family N-acetyltransferase n=1 Tax=Chitinivorax sp. PXF-14 TaxID=3230488 RepID=UPI00346782FE
MNLHVRLATPADLDRLALLFDAYRQFYTLPADLALSRAYLGERMRKAESLLLVADAGDGLAGFIQMYPTFSSLAADRIYTLEDLFVDPAYRGHGVGRQLMTAAAAAGRERGAVQLVLSTATDNATAQALYESLGWQRDIQFFYYALNLAPLG